MFKVQLPITTAAAVSTQHYLQIRPQGLKSGTETTKSTQLGVTCEKFELGDVPTLN